MAGGVINKIVAGGNTHSISATFYGTCDTAADTAAKEIIINDPVTTTATFEYGMTLAVKFTNANGVASPTITCFNNSGTKAAPTKGTTTLLAAKRIKRYGTTDPSTNAATSWRAGAMVLFIYDGSYWVEISGIDDNTIPTIYCNTAAATAAKEGQLSGGVLATGYYVCQIVHGNSAASAITLNVNGKGAKAIYINNVASSATNYTLPAGMYIVYYATNKFRFRTDGAIPALVRGGASISINTTKIGTTAVSDGVLDLTNVLTAASLTDKI